MRALAAIEVSLLLAGYTKVPAWVGPFVSVGAYWGLYWGPSQWIPLPEGKR